MLLNESIEKRTTLYVGNISSNITKEDIMELFGLNTKKYLRDKSSAELCFNTKSKYKGYAYLNIPHHISTEILKLDGFEYNSRKLTIQKAVNPTFNHRTDKSFLPYNRRGMQKGGVNRRNLATSSSNINAIRPASVTSSRQEESNKDEPGTFWDEVLEEGREDDNINQSNKPWRKS